MRRIVIAVLLAGTLGAPSGSVRAGEPDGRAAFRYAWTAPARLRHPRPLRLTIAVVSPMRDAHLTASLPSSVSLRLDGVRRSSGASVAAPVDGVWPADGIALGDLAAGETVIVELGLTSEPSGGGIVAFGVDAEAGGRPVREGVGVPVGTPGTPSTLRNGAAEFPARRLGSAR